VTYAAHTRRFAGNIVPHNLLACDVLLGMTMDEAAEVCLEYFPATATISTPTNGAVICAGEF